jgi:predicted O-methyltransferase YrrM
MSQDLFSQVDDYIVEALVAPDAALAEALEASRAAGLPDIAVAPNQGKLLHLLAKTIGARRILELGTLGGYSTIWLARALREGGSVLTLEALPKHAEVAQANFARAGADDRIQTPVGPALDTLPLLLREEAGPFDLTFIDADKQNNAAYFDWAVKLSRPGSLVIVDNVVRRGAVLDATSTDPAILGTRRLYEQVARDPRVEATAVQTVGGKGHDGFIVARVR